MSDDLNTTQNLRITDIRYGGTPRIRDEVVLRTACGCEKIVSVPIESRLHQQRIQVDPPYVSNRSWEKVDRDVTYTIRRFYYEGQHDRVERRIFQERVERQEPWEQRYRDLYNDVYGVDTGL